MICHSFNIEGTLPNLNEYIRADRVMIRGRKGCFSKGNKLKQDAQQYVSTFIKSGLNNLHIENQIKIKYHFYEPNKRRDKDNVAAFAMKVIQDALVKEGVIKNDGWRNIESFECLFDVDKNNPRIEVTLEEIS